ncbi:ubiquitin carboxyl-terminal hydrolase 47 [Cloeon dipterum]|uniref:ubiquitin carboxyl-terminal hydrolase 47 n=1 Tax=Cloeon dipterum TaxID=197152 RepID=UPI00321F8F2D
MVCSRTAEEQEQERMQEDTANTDQQVPSAEPQAPTPPPLPVEEEQIGTIYLHNHITFDDVTSPVSIFVRTSSTVDDLYQQIAKKLEVQESDFDINYKTEIVSRETPSLKLSEVGITFEDGKRVSLTLTAKVKSKKTKLPSTMNLRRAVNVNSDTEEAAVPFPSDYDLASLPALTAPAIEACEKKYVGLVNQAMTCYLNSLIQSLYMTPEFRNALYKWEFDCTDEESRRKSIPFQLQRLFLKLQTSSKAAVETTDLTKSFGWDSSDSWTQHDVQELCRVMFAALEHKFRNTEQADLINRLYQGNMIDYVKCMECGKEGQREDTFLDIPLPIRPFGNETAYGTVEDALKGFVEPETLDGNNQYACENCNKKCDAKKGLKFVKIPYLLTLHLMRFSFDYNSLHRLKLNDKVVFPEILDMNPFICKTGIEPQKEKEVGEAEEVVKQEEKESQDAKVPENGEHPNGDESLSSMDDSLPPLEIVEEVEMQPSTESASAETPVVNGKAKMNGEDIEDDVFENGEATCISDNNEKNTQRSLEKGPYMYELFAIMIHSGNASGGHYYAYIKDFTSGQWFCFNDQNVTRITSDDIRKTFGGSRANYYSGYSPSTSAYMLMYRQIDKERNAKFIQVEDFPDHIKTHLAAMQNGNGADSFSRDYLMDSAKVKVFCYLPTSDRQVNCKLNCLSSLTLPEVIQLALKELNLQSYPLENCRLVCYDNSNFTITKSLQDLENNTIGEISPKLHDKLNFLLQIKTTSDPWQPYISGDAIGRVYTVDIETEEIQGPHLVQINYMFEVREFKYMLQKFIPDMFASVPVEKISVVMEKLSLESLYPAEDSSQLFDSDSYACTLKKIFVAVYNEGDKSFQNTKLLKLIDRYLNIICLDVSLPDLESEDLEDQEIPLLSAVKQQKTEEEQVVDGSSLTPVRPQSSLQVVPPSALSSDPPSNEEDLAASTDQSASEDSSLTDSDRTLVGDQENLLVQLSSPSDESAAGDGNAVSSPDDPPQDKGLKIESDWDEMDGGRVSHSRPQSNSYFKATLMEEGTNKYLKVDVDKRGTMSWFKKQLESYVGVPCDYFKVVRSNDEYDYQTLTPTFRDGDKVNVRLGRALKKGEYTGKIYKLTPDDADPLKFLFNCTLSNGMLVGDAKKQILKDLKRKNNIEISFERCRLRKKSWKNPGQVYYDHQKFEESMCFSSNWEMFLQEIPEDWPQKNDNDSLPELVLFVRKWSPSTLTLGPFQEVELDSTSGQELKEKLSVLSDVPIENIGIVKAPGSFPCDISVLNVQSELEWVTVANNLNEWPFNIFEDGHVIFYRDNSEQVKELTAEERKKIERDDKFRRPRGVGSWTSAAAAPRKERGLRIYLDPTPPKSSAPLAAVAPNELFSKN